MYGASGRLNHDGFAGGKLFNGEDQVSPKFNILRKSSIYLYADAVQILAFQKVSASAIEAFPASQRSAGGSALAFFEPGDRGSKLNDLTRKFVTRREGKTLPEFTFVYVEIGAADTTGVDAEKNFVGLNFWNSNIPVFEFTRGVVNNGFHNEVNGSIEIGERAIVCSKTKRSQRNFKDFHARSGGCRIDTLYAFLTGREKSALETKFPETSETGIDLERYEGTRLWIRVPLGRH